MLLRVWKTLVCAAIGIVMFNLNSDISGFGFKIFNDID